MSSSWYVLFHVMCSFMWLHIFQYLIQFFFISPVNVFKSPWLAENIIFSEGLSSWGSLWACLGAWLFVTMPYENKEQNSFCCRVVASVELDWERFGLMGFRRAFGTLRLFGGQRSSAPWDSDFFTQGNHLHVWKSTAAAEHSALFCDTHLRTEAPWTPRLYL